MEAITKNKILSTRKTNGFVLMPKKGERMYNFFRAAKKVKIDKEAVLRLRKLSHPR